MSVIEFAVWAVYYQGKQARADGQPRRVPKKYKSTKLQERWLQGWDERDAEFLQMHGHAR